ncbi:plasma membrane ATPase 2-like [Helianthus annuus]|uniref:plasma membrane ATPase 2-like n=1 Tax=Helianthus annuus TaxID=4232 RepID=UPI00165312A4|nr:plasma membrane ATPase 2-like [Helianthus annuus]
MDEEFYNAFATPSTPITVAQTTMLDNETGTLQKPPKLLNIEEYKGWEGRFKNWVQANYLDAWECVETKYVIPLNDDGEEVAIKDMSADDKKKYKNEKMMLSLLQQTVKEDIMVLLQHNGSSYSIWKALRSKFVDIANKVHWIIDNFSECGLRSLGVTFQEVLAGKKESIGELWEFVDLLPLFNPTQHDSSETINRRAELYILL